MKKILSLFLALTLVLTVGLLSVGCNAITLPTTSTNAANSPTGTTSQPVAQGKLQVLITDAPPKPEVTKVELTVSKIEVHKAGLEEEVTTTPSTTPTETPTTTPTETVTPSATPAVDNGWIVLEITGPKTFDLLQLKGIEEEFALQPLEPGKYTQIRLTVDKAMVTLGTATPVEAVLPSGVLKFIHPFEIKTGETTAILMDFIAEESVKISGNEQITVKPVVKLSTKDNKPAETITDEQAGQETAQKFIEEDATFKFDGVENSIILDKSEAGPANAPKTWIYTFKFQTANAGHGDRSEVTLVPGITNHTAVITVNKKGEVASAVCDGTWDMVTELEITESPTPTP